MGHASARVAEVYEDQLSDLPEATRRYEAVLAVDPPNARRAVKGLDRIYNRTGQYRELLDVLERQIQRRGDAAPEDQPLRAHRRPPRRGVPRPRARPPRRLEAILAIDGSTTARSPRSRVTTARSTSGRTSSRSTRSTQHRHGRQAPARAARSPRPACSPSRSARRSAHQGLRADAGARPDHAERARGARAAARAASGDSHAALPAIEALANKAAHARSEGRAVDARRRSSRRAATRTAPSSATRMRSTRSPRTPAATHLRAAYAERGDVASGSRARRREIHARRGRLRRRGSTPSWRDCSREKLTTTRRAEAAATKAIGSIPPNVDALHGPRRSRLRGGAASSRRRSTTSSPANRADELPKDDASACLVRFVEALSKTGSTEKALAPMDKLLALAPDDAEALARVARVIARPRRSAGRALRALPRAARRFRDRLTQAEDAEALYRLGETARRAGDLEARSRRSTRRPISIPAARAAPARSPRSTSEEGLGGGGAA